MRQRLFQYFKNILGDVITSVAAAFIKDKNYKIIYSSEFIVTRSRNPYDTLPLIF